MKLHEALRKILKQFGTSVMQDGKRLMSMMADFHAFEDYPAMKQVMGAVFTGRYGKELFTRAADDESGDYELYIGYLRRAEITSSTSGISGSRLFRSFISVRNLPPTQWTAFPLPWRSAAPWQSPRTTAMTPAAWIKALLQSRP